MLLDLELTILGLVEEGHAAKHITVDRHQRLFVFWLVLLYDRLPLKFDEIIREYRLTVLTLLHLWLRVHHELSRRDRYLELFWISLKTHDEVFEFEFFTVVELLEKLVVFRGLEQGNLLRISSQGLEHLHHDVLFESQGEIVGAQRVEHSVFEVLDWEHGWVHLVLFPQMNENILDFGAA